MPAYRRVPNWSALLEQYLARVRDEGFTWGMSDCGMFAARAVDVQLGTGDLYQRKVRDRLSYNDEGTAVATLERCGGLVAVVSELIDSKTSPIGQCGRGSIIAYRHPWKGQAGLAVHDGSQIVGPWSDGLRSVPRALALCGWRVM